MRITFFYLLLAALVATTWWRGRTDERLAAAVCVAGTVLTVLLADDLQASASPFDVTGLAVDGFVFVAFLTIALRSERFWPLWVAGLQLTTIIVHLVISFAPELPGLVFGAALAFWSYPIIALIAVGALRTPAVERWRAAADIASSERIT